MKRFSFKLLGILGVICLLANSSFAATIIAPGTNIHKNDANKDKKSTVIGVGVAKSTDEEAASNEKVNASTDMTGFVKDINGNWMIKEGGETLKKGWYTDTDGSLYRTDSRGYMCHGLTRVKEEGSKAAWYIMDTRHNGHFGAVIKQGPVTIQYNGITTDLQISPGGEIPAGAISNVREAAKVLSGGTSESFDYNIDTTKVEVVDVKPVANTQANTQATTQTSSTLQGVVSQGVQ